MNTWRWRQPFKDTLTISRTKEHELEKAIKDLEKRGYELVKRWEESNEFKTFNRFNEAGYNNGKYSYSDHYEIKKFYALLKRAKLRY